MICARCGHDSKRKERESGRCPSCKGQFAFNQDTLDPVSDKAFAGAIDAVSAGGQVRWGVEHLYYEVSRRVKPNPRFAIFLVPLGLVIAMSIFLGVRGLLIALVVIAIGVAIARRRRPRRPRPRLAPNEFDALWKRWCRAHGMPKGVIERRDPAGAPPRLAPEPDLALYSFDRAVICDRARTVDLLLANNFHFENNCAVLSVDGYPKGAFETVRTMLRRNPKLRVFALHDCTPAGCTLAYRLAGDPEWFSGRTVVDVGLRPRHAFPLPQLLAASGASAALAGISPSERDWLARDAAEIAMLWPEQVLRRLFRAMNRQDEAELDVDEADQRRVKHDDDSFSVEADFDDGGGDSFG